MASKPKDSAPLVSILIPVFNEERNVGPAYDAVVAQFEALTPRYRFEILFTDNHSTDGTEAKLAELAARDPRVKVLRFARNFGFQRSILTAYRHAKGDAAIQLDCDLQDPPEMIPEFLAEWEKGHDVVVGIRRRRAENFLMRAARRVYYRLVTAISDDNIVENAGDFRLVGRSVLDLLGEVNDMQPYTRGLISSLAARQTGIPYDRRERLHEQSKFPLRRLSGFAADGIVSHSMVPLRLASFAGTAVFFGTLVLCAFYFGAWLLAGRQWPAGFATTTILLLLSIGLNGMFVGIVGEYVGRIYCQVRWRPLTIVERSANLEAPDDSARLGEEEEKS